MACQSNGLFQMGSFQMIGLTSGTSANNSSVMNTITNYIPPFGATFSGATASMPTVVSVINFVNAKTPAAPSSSNPFIYVSKTGNDSTGSGSMNNPVLTVTQAQTIAGPIIAALPTGSTSMVTIHIGPGFYTETIPMNIKPKTTYTALGRSITTIIADMGLGDTMWSDPTGTSANICIFNNITLKSQVSGSTFSFLGASAEQATIIFENTGIVGNLSVVAASAVSPSIIVSRSCEISASGSTFSCLGGIIQLYDTVVTSANSLFTSTIASALTLTAFNGGFTTSSTGTVVLQGVTNNPCTCSFSNTQLPANITINQATVKVDSSSLNTTGSFTYGGVTGGTLLFTNAKNSSILYDVYGGASGSTTGVVPFTPFTSSTTSVENIFGPYGVALVNSVPVVGSYVGISFGIQPPGRYALSYDLVKGLTCGIVEVYENNLGITIRAAFDTFQGVTSTSTGTISGITDYFSWPTNGNMEIRWIVPTKNTSSSGYFAYLSNIVQLTQMLQ